MPDEKQIGIRTGEPYLCVHGKDWPIEFCSECATAPSGGSSGRPSLSRAAVDRAFDRVEADQAARAAAAEAPIVDMTAAELREIANVLEQLDGPQRYADRCYQIAALLERATPAASRVSVALEQHAKAEPVLQFFQFDHLPQFLRRYSAPFAALAVELVDGLPDNPQREAALWKLLEAKDCAVRARIYKRGPRS